MAREATHDIFEQNLFAYYLMALAVSLVLLDVSRGRIRRSVLAWLAAVTLVFCVGASPAFDFVSWGGYLRELVPLFVVAPLLLVILVRILRGDASRDMLPWLVVVACALLSWPTHADPLSFPSVTWFWQGVLVVPGSCSPRACFSPKCDGVRGHHHMFVACTISPGSSIGTEVHPARRGMVSTSGSDVGGSCAPIDRTSGPSAITMPAGTRSSCHNHSGSGARSESGDHSGH